ncbi:MAG: DUF6273 domain-containing protein [Clostridia bacterium]|nr:DUF6273 domain-containing protein [Clostridia bacterium]
MKKTLVFCLVCLLLVLAIGVTFTACKGGSSGKKKVYTITTESNAENAGTFTQFSAEVKKPGESVTLTALSNTGYSFAGWFDGEDLLSSDLNYTFEMPAKSVTYTARFERMRYKLSTQISNPDAGEYTALDKEEKLFDESVTLTATVKTGYDFVGWYDGTKRLSAELEYTFNMPAKDSTYTAKYANQIFTLNTEVNDEAGGTYTSCKDKEYAYLDQVTLAAEPSEEYIFIGWYDGESRVSADPTYTFEMPAKDLSYTAIFDKKDGWRFSTSTNDTAGGFFTKYVDILVKTGTRVELRTSPNDGYTFVGWYEGDALVSQEGEFVFTMPMREASLEARFIAYTVSTNTDLEDAGTYTKITERKKREGENVTLSARSYAGYLWNGWYDGEELLTKEKTYSFDMGRKNVTYTASFSVCSHEKSVGCFCSYCGAIAHDYSDGVCTRCGDQMIQRVNAAGEPAANGQYVLFGTYLQSKVTDASLAEEVSARAGLLPTEDDAFSWRLSENKNYYFVDVFYDGANYRAIYRNGETSVYKYEPIKWRIARNQSGIFFLISECVLDARKYDVGSNGYKDSDIREYLNSDFKNRVFTAAQLEYIESTTVDNGVASTGYASNPNACDDTEDLFFLLSYAEATNSSLGFSSNDDRKIAATDYAIKNGLNANDQGNGDWWLRSPNNEIAHRARCVDPSGAISHYDVYVLSRGILPAMRISLS